MSLLRLSVPCIAVLVGFAAACVPAPRLTPPAPNPPVANTCQVVNVVDGDTVDMACQGQGRFRARLTGYDTPESYEPGCPAEANAARAATQRLRDLVHGSSVVDASVGGLDRYNRRLVALRLDGRDVGTTMISEGLAVPYHGGRRIDWCRHLR